MTQLETIFLGWLLIVESISGPEGAILECILASTLQTFSIYKGPFLKGATNEVIISPVKR